MVRFGGIRWFWVGGLFILSVLLVSCQGLEGTYISADGSEKMEFRRNGEVYITDSVGFTVLGKYELQGKRLIVKVEIFGITEIAEFTIEGDRIVSTDGKMVYARKR
jgi:hypothetical protein